MSIFNTILQQIIFSSPRGPHTSTGDAVEKLVEYFMAKITSGPLSNSVQEMEDLLEKGSKLLHHNHYVVTLIKIKVPYSLDHKKISFQFYKFTNC